MEICPKCGLPKQACICQEIARTEQRIRVKTEKKKFGKLNTIVEGLESDADIKNIARELKVELACGGTVKNSKIELQGDHLRKIKPVLIRLGFKEELIEEA